MNDPLDPFRVFAPDRPWVPPEFATPEGIVGVGGELGCDTLLKAYTAGVFPWFNPGDPVIWWSPDPRGVIPLDTFHVPRRLAATIRQNRFRVTVNTRFSAIEIKTSDGESWYDALVTVYVRAAVRFRARSLF